MSTFAVGAQANDSSDDNSASPTGRLSFQVPDLPDGLSVLALIDGKWRAMVAADGMLTSVPEVKYPRGVAYHHQSHQIAWIGADSKLRVNDLANGKTTVLNAELEATRFTQPTFHPDGGSLIVVALPDGKSRSTRIMEYELNSARWRFLVRKRTAQFEPHLSNLNLLHYTTAICVDDCIGMIWELWQKDLNSGKQIQLTLLNAVSKSPRLSTDGWLYFSSNKDTTGFHLWRMKPEPGAPQEQLTSGKVKDSDPSPADDGSVYFIRNSSSGSTLMHWTKTQTLEIISLPDAITGLRNLELRP